MQEEELPLTLPPTQDFKPSGRPESPLAKITEWVQTTDPSTGVLAPPGATAHPIYPCTIARLVRIARLIFQPCGEMIGTPDPSGENPPPSPPSPSP